MASESLYKNPFQEYNASVLENSKILDYWCSPYNYLDEPDMAEHDVYHVPNPIVFMGGRGSGKTMFLKYFSYQVQREDAIRSKRQVIDHIRAMGGVGFYLRFDGPVLRSFAGKDIEQKKWDAIFTHYFELHVCKAIIEVIKDLIYIGGIDANKVEEAFVPQVTKKLGGEDKLSTVCELFAKIESLIEEITEYRAKVPFDDIEFKPKKIFPAQYLSCEVAEIARKTISELQTVNFVILIDEYENFLVDQQRIINTILKFVKPGVTFRLGMRLEGFHTFDTISENEFIKEGRDYTKFVFETFLYHGKKYKEFLSEVARKRIEAVSALSCSADISKYLGETEDLEQEALDIVKGQRRHFELLKMVLEINAALKAEEKIRLENKPLIELLAILWILRGRTPDDVANAMKDYLEGIKSADAIKFGRDYTDKYKLSLVFLLASIYHKNKKYYSFNTLCYLSSGIVGHFLELCRKSFQYAYFENRDTLVQEGTISRDVQDRAARDVANSELDMIKRIPKHGDRLYSLAKNLGNIFMEYHKDKYIRYPETNLFSLDLHSVTDISTRDGFKAAISWSIIQKKPNLQQSSPGTGRNEIYTLNRIFSPIFHISYRTRGGYTESFSADDLKELMNSDNVKPKKMTLEPSRKRKNIQKVVVDDINSGLFKGI